MTTNDIDLIGLDDLTAPEPVELPPGVLLGDCIELMREMPDDSVDSIVTDPPYGLGFMGKKWDALPPGEEWARECLRVLKPGGHLIAFGGSRTWHRLAVAIEDAGFEIRDGVLWLYGSGFPKSHDVSKAIDKMAGAEREITRFERVGIASGSNNSVGGSKYVVGIGDTPATPEAQQWEGWGTALKPAYEPAVMARKPFRGTVAANVLEHGTGAINIDASRIRAEGGDYDHPGNHGIEDNDIFGKANANINPQNNLGRFPANLILDEHTAELLDEQSGNVKGRVGMKAKTAVQFGVGRERSAQAFDAGIEDSGGASRFFYVAKAPKSERPVVDGVAHATVKPLKLMRYLVAMVTPPGGLVLDPFAGTGTTAEAAILDGFQYLVMEREAEYIPLIQTRIERAQTTLMEELL